MSSDLLIRAVRGAPSVTLNYDPSVNKLASLSTVQGQKLLIPQFQVPVSNPNKMTSNLWRYSASGNFTNILQTGGQVSIKIDRGSGSGKTRGDAYLRMVITNTHASADVSIVPIPFLIAQMNFQSPAGDVIQNWDGMSLWWNLITTCTYDVWQSTSLLVDASDYYEQGEELLHQDVYEFLLPLRGNFMSVGELFWPAVDGDGQAYITFATPTATIISGSASNLQLTQLSLDVEMDQADSGLQRELLAEYKLMEHNWIVPFMRTQSWTQTFNVDSQYSFALSGIKGDVVFAFFVLRDTLNGRDVYHGRPIASFQFTNDQGIAISGAQFITDQQNRHAQAPRWWLGTWMEERHFYSYVFGAESGTGPAFITTGQKNGSYTFTTNENLIINTAPAGTNEVMALQASAGTPASGNVVFSWTTPHGGTWCTDPVAFGATGADIKAAIEALPNFQGTVTVSAGLAAGTTFTFSGNYANKPLMRDGYFLEVVSSTVATSAPAVIDYNIAPSVGGDRGITNGNTYTLSLYALTSSILSLKGGAFRVQNA